MPVSPAVKTLLTIWAHKEVQATVNRHMHLWEQHLNTDIVFICPTNSVIWTPYPVLAMEVSKHNGVEINRKFRKMLEFWLLCHHDRFMFCEYDAFCVSQDLPDLDAGKLYGNLFNSTEPQFKGHYYLHPPIVVCRPVLEDLVRFARTVPDETDRFWDRLLGYYCEYGKIPFSGYGERGFARNTIDPCEVPAAVDARRNGALMFHGVKSEAALRAIVNA